MDPTIIIPPAAGFAALWVIRAIVIWLASEFDKKN
jgi:hypothetical protein